MLIWLGSVALTLIILGLNLFIRSRQINIRDDQEKIRRLGGKMLWVAVILIPLSIVIYIIGVGVSALQQAYVSLGASMLSLVINLISLGLISTEPVESRPSLGKTTTILSILFLSVGAILMVLVVYWNWSTIVEVYSLISK
jgi:hypothetical protein